jgi:hypothetical protein
LNNVSFDVKKKDIFEKGIFSLLYAQTVGSSVTNWRVVSIGISVIGFAEIDVIIGGVVSTDIRNV